MKALHVVALAVAGVAGLASSVQAAMTTQAYWELGEADGVSVGSALAATTVATTGSPNLGLVAAGGTYVSGVPTGGSLGLPSGMTSTLAAGFSGSSNNVYGTSGTVPVSLKATDNFCLEAWIKPSAVNIYQTVVYLGNNIIGSSGSGYGIMLTNKGEVRLFYGGTGGVSDVYTNATVSANQWTHLALVVSGGVPQLYLNGTAESFSGTLPTTIAAPASGIGIGGIYYGGAPFKGAIDDVRYSTFAAGSFSPNDLLVSVPEPSLLGLAGVSVLGLLRRRHA